MERVDVDFACPRQVDWRESTPTCRSLPCNAAVRVWAVRQIPVNPDWVKPFPAFRMIQTSTGWGLTTFPRI